MIRCPAHGYHLLSISYYTVSSDLAYWLSVFQELLSRGDSLTAWNFREFYPVSLALSPAFCFIGHIKAEAWSNSEPGARSQETPDSSLCFATLRFKKLKCHTVIVTSFIQGVLRFGVRQLRHIVLTLLLSCEIFQISLSWRPRFPHSCSDSGLFLLDRGALVFKEVVFVTYLVQCLSQSKD